MAKRALVAGINDYQNWHRASPVTFPDLHWCVADATAFATLLTTSFGFSPDDVIFCQDSEATLQGLLGGITNLFSQSQPGDVMCFYFAGHGGRVPENGWGVPANRYYESIVPYDGAGMILDNQIAAIAQSSLAAQVNFTAVLDCSHSGGIATADGVTSYRAFTWDDPTIAAFVSSCRTLIPLVSLPDPSVLDGNISGAARSGSGVLVNVDAGKDFSDRAGGLLLSACNYNETAGESSTLSHGYLTNALLETANQSDFQMNPVDLLAAVRQKVAGYSGGRQSPQLRGRPVRQQESFLGGFTAGA